MRLSELLDGLDYRRAAGVADPECDGLAYDSRRVTPGTVFFALPGEKTDGHDHAAEAVERGAVAVVAERDCGLPSSVAQVFTVSTRKAMAFAAARFHRNPSRNLKVIGITGIPESGTAGRAKGEKYIAFLSIPLGFKIP